MTESARPQATQGTSDGTHSAKGAGASCKHCTSCGRRIAPRKRWRYRFSEVRYCSKACHRRGVRPLDVRLEDAILALLDRRRRDASICPSEAVRTIAGEDAWLVLMEPARRAARRLVYKGQVEIVQGGRVVDPSDFRGPIRIRVRR